MPNSAPVEASAEYRTAKPTRLAVFGVWTLMSVLVAMQTGLRARTDVEAISWLRLLVLPLAYWYGWALWTPLIFALTRFVAAPRMSWPSVLAVHITAALCICITMLAWFALLMRWFGEAVEPEFAVLFWRYFVFGFHYDVLTYAAVLGAGIAFRYHSLWQERAHQALRLKQQLAETQLNALRSQLQPHFLFNTLNTVSALVESDPAQSRRVLARLSNLLRRTLDLGDRVFVELRDEIRIVQDYVDIQQTRFRDRLDFTCEVDPDCQGFLVPPLVLQPLVENAFRHGVEPTDTTCQIDVRCHRDGELLQLDVCDNGPGLAAKHPVKRSGVGLSNLRARLEHIYGGDATITLSSRTTGGAHATVRIPLREDAARTL